MLHIYDSIAAVLMERFKEGFIIELYERFLC